MGSPFLCAQPQGVHEVEWQHIKRRDVLMKTVSELSSGVHVFSCVMTGGAYVLEPNACQTILLSRNDWLHRLSGMNELILILFAVKTAAYKYF